MTHWGPSEDTGSHELSEAHSQAWRVFTLSHEGFHFITGGAGGVCGQGRLIHALF